MKLLIFLTLLAQLPVYALPTVEKPLRVGIAGMTHGHVHSILRAVRQGDVELAGIAEPNKAMAERLMKQYGIAPHLLYVDLEEMVVQTKPEAVVAFGSIYDHLNVVRTCAPRKIHVMVEKPLAVSLEHAEEMEHLARTHDIHLLTNYETTWYGSHHKAQEMLAEDNAFGDVVKMVVHDGHQGPREIGVNEEFLEWLTDPVLNGGGALMDFGCYGANLITWLMKGERPVSVLAVTQQIKPQTYPKVDDEATIILTYPKAQGIIQASWNWPYSRKDLEVYGTSGYFFADKQTLRYSTSSPSGEVTQAVPPPESPRHDPFHFFTAVVRGSIRPDNNDLSGLPVNMMAMEILEAAKVSARTGKVVHLKAR